MTSNMLFKLLLILLSMVGACGAPLVNSGSHRQKGKFSDFVPNTKQIKISVRDIRTLASRLPRAFSRSITSSAKSFVTSTAVLIPVGLVLNIKQLKPVDAWLLKGVTTGVEWAKVGAYFVVGAYVV